MRKRNPAVIRWWRRLRFPLVIGVTLEEKAKLQAAAIADGMPLVRKSYERFKTLLRDYEHGLGFSKGDILKTKAGVLPITLGGDGTVIDTVVVLYRHEPIMAPHMYTVLGEHPSPRTPSDRFVLLFIDGHDWEQV